jgi:hypothetical protein
MGMPQLGGLERGVRWGFLLGEGGGWADHSVQKRRERRWRETRFSSRIMTDRKPVNCSGSFDQLEARGSDETERVFVC